MQPGATRILISPKHVDTSRIPLHCFLTKTTPMLCVSWGAIMCASLFDIGHRLKLDAQPHCLRISHACSKLTIELDRSSVYVCILWSYRRQTRTQLAFELAHTTPSQILANATLVVPMYIMLSKFPQLLRPSSHAGEPVAGSDHCLACSDKLSDRHKAMADNHKFRAPRNPDCDIVKVLHPCSSCQVACHCYMFMVAAMAQATHSAHHQSPRLE